MATEDAPTTTGEKHRSAVFWLTWDFLVPLAVALVLSLWMATGGRDLDWQRAVAGPDGTWPRGDTAFWQFFYRFGPLPAVLVCIGAVIGLVAGAASPKLRPWRRVFWYPVLLVAIAPGIIANLILKEHWGRPRPREVEEFGGRFDFEPLFSLDPAGTGKSFPCGHATMGFFFVAGYFLLRKTHFRLSLAVLAVALALGGVMGYMRMIQGGHFATDAVWAAAITFFTAAGLFHALGLNRRLLDEVKLSSAPSRVPLKVKFAGGLAIIGLVAGLALAMPYHAPRDFSVLHPDAATLTLKPSIKIALGEAEIVPGEKLQVTGEAWGHGLPTSEIASRWDEEAENDILRVRLVQRLSGYLTEIRQNLHVTIPWNRTAAAKFDLGPGTVRLQLPLPDEPKRIELQLNGTDLTIEVDPETRLEISTDQVEPGTILGTWESAETGPRYGLVFTKWEGGKVTILSGSGKKLP